MVVEPVKPVAVEPAPVVVAPPVVEEVVYPYGVRPIVKNADGNEVFDLFIVHTNDVKGNIYAENGGVGIAKLSTALKAGREITDNWLLLNTGYVGEIPAEAALTAASIVDELGYDAYLPQAIQIELGIEGTQKAIPLAANVLDAEEYLLFQPYQVYDFNGFTVGVVGIVAPKPVSGVSFDADVILDNAQWAVDIARTYVDYLVVLTDLGEGVFSSSDLAENIQGIDLIVDGSGSETAKVVNDTLIVRAEEQLRSIGGVVVSVDRGRVTGVLPLVLPAEDLAVPYLSPLAAEYEPFANALGYTLMVTLPEDPAIVEQIGPTPEKVAVVVPVPVVKVEEKPAPPPAPAPAPPPAPPAPAPVVEEVVPIKITRPVEPREFPLGVTSIVKNAAGDKDFDLFVVHTNDVHGRITPSDGGMGYSKLATMLEVGRSITDNILVLDAGDVSHGTNLANLFEGEVVGVLLDMLGYDAVVPGNHDFNYGSERLIQAAEFAEEYSNLRVLAANVLDEDGYLVFQPYQVYDFNGFTVGVVGLTTPDTKTKSHPKNTAGLTILNEEIFAIGQQVIDIARTYVDYVIVLGHIGLDPDGASGLTSDMIVSKIKGIDLFVDGHSHDALEKGLKIGDSYIVSAGEYLENVGVVEINVRGGKVVGTTPMLIPAEDVLNPEESDLARAYGIVDVPNHLKVDEYVTYMQAQLSDKLNQVIATIPVDLNGERAHVRTRPTNLSKIITAAMTEQSGADFTITNGGGIRASLKAGPVTIGDVINVLPFTNILTVVEATGAEVYAALEHGYRMLPETNGGFAQTDLSVVYNRFAEPGKRIVRVLLNGKAIDKNKTYRVATNDFLAAGGDGYTMFGRILVEGDLLSDVLIKYLSTKKLTAEMLGDEVKEVVVAEEKPAPAPEPAPAPVPAPVVAEVKPAKVEAVEYPLGVMSVVKNSAGDKDFDLFVVHTNDVHARITPSDGGMGYSKLATMLEVGRSITDNILLLDAGDVSHGTNLANLFEGETVGVLLDMLGYDAVAPGNHDFNYGYKRLVEAAEFAEEYSALRVLSANVVDEDGYLVFQPYQVYDYNGFTVGVVGLTTPDTKTKSHPKNTEGLTFLNKEILDLGQELVDIARNYVDYIIVLGHIGLDPDGASGLTSEMIVRSINGIDLFVDGHSHTTLEKGLKVNDTYIVSAGDYLRNVGVVEINVRGGKVVGTTPMLIPAKDVLNPQESDLARAYGITAVPNNAEVDEYVTYMQGQLNDVLNKVIAKIPMDLDGERANVRTRPTNLSKIIAAAMTAQSGADFSITNGGGIRASLKAGPVTVGDVVNVLPFTNILTVVEATGADVYAALEHGYRMLPDPNGGFAQTDLSVVYNRFAEPGKRIVRVLLNGKAIDKNKTYRVATNDFLAAGGDGYTMFGRVLVEGDLLSDILIKYLSETYPVR